MKLLIYILISILSTIFLGVIVSIFIVSIFMSPNKYLDLAILDIFSTKKIEAAQVKRENKKKLPKKNIRVFIDPGHDAKTVGAEGVEKEYILNYKLASMLGERLEKDERFYFETSRDLSNYSENIKKYGESNYTNLRKIIKMEVKGEERSNPLAISQYVDMYSVRNYAIDNNFDCLISIHFDYVAPRYQKNMEGYHIIVSPYNGEFFTSMNMAKALAKRMKEKYFVSSGFRYDPKIPKNIWKYYDKDEIRQDGIALRSLIVLGDKYEYTYYKQSTNQKRKDIPSILLETGFIHETKFTNQTVLKDIADRIYLALCDIFI